MINAYKEFWKNYVNFGGKTNRGGFWWVILVNIIITALLSILIAILPVLSVVPSIYSLATLIPGIAICVRRLRDSGHKWYSLFLLLIPIVGWIILIVFLAQQSK